MSGRLLRRLTPAEELERRSQRVYTPGDGTRVALWRLPGRWAVWAPGPKRATVWLVAADVVARDVLAELDRDQGAAAPVALEVYRGATGAHAVAVECSELRAGVNLRGEA